jgi:hypothetical protein
VRLAGSQPLGGGLAVERPLISKSASMRCTAASAMGATKAGLPP